MGEVQEASIDISSRIKQFSNGKPKLDSNSNFTHKKPDPAPRKRRPQTTEVNYNNNERRSLVDTDRKSVNRSSSSPVAQRKPVVPTKPIGSKPLMPPTSKKDHNVIKPNINNNNNNNALGKSTANDRNKRTSGEKPALPLKPVIPVKPTNLAVSDQQNKNKTPIREKSWKQAAGPPRSPLPSGPGQYHNTVIVQNKTSSPLPPKPLRGQQRVEVYENNDVDLNNRIKSNRSDCRRETLDGQMILGTITDVSTSVTSSKDASEDCKFKFFLFIFNFY